MSISHIQLQSKGLALVLLIHLTSVTTSTLSHYTECLLSSARRRDYREMQLLNLVLLMEASWGMAQWFGTSLECIPGTTKNIYKIKCCPI